MAAQPVRVAAAASFRQALDQIVAAYEKQSGQRIVVTYGATGNLTGQMLHGAPFDMLLAADEEGTARLATAGLTTGPPQILVRGRISLVLASKSPIGIRLAFTGDAIESVLPDVGGLRDALATGKIRRFAIANPELAPYGRAAKEALTKLNLLELTRPRFVFGENVGQVAQYVASGAAEAGITAHALTIAEPLASALQTFALPQGLHGPINQTFVVVKQASAAAADFARFLVGPEARAIFDRNGFDRP
ncbi:MAG: molybdate ABC transporter substrate-binding protein [Hyphomicrobiaceae bacterium]